METKKCYKCKESKELEQFCKNKNYNDGLNKECKPCKKIYNEINKEKIKLTEKRYRNNNPNFKEYKRNYFPNYKKKRKEYDPLFRLTENIRTSIHNSLLRKGFSKNSNTKNILGCSFEEFMIYLESKFESWMNWDNQGNPKDGVLEYNKSWDIDHIIPSSTANNIEDIIKLNHYTNFQPLCSKMNREIKRNKI